MLNLTPGADLTFTAGPCIVGGTCSEGNSQATVLSLTPNLVAVSLHEFGSVIARAPLNGNASAHADSSGQVAVIGGTQMRDGSIEWEAHAHFSTTVSGRRNDFAGPAYKDPLIGRKHNRATGETETHTLLAIEALPMNGTLTWDNDILRSESTNLRFAITMDSPWTIPGTLLFQVEENVVTHSSATGMFSGIVLPPIGSSGGAVEINLPSTVQFDYHMGGSETDDLDIEIDGSGAGASEDADVALPIFHSTFTGIPEPNTYLTNFGVGHDGANVSEVEAPSSVPGYSANINQSHVAEDFTVPSGQSWQLSAAMLPLFDEGSNPEDPITSALVRVWLGTPGLEGYVITENTIDVVSYFDNAYRVFPEDLEVSQNALKQALLDLSWVPALDEGTYWLEIGAEGIDPNFGPFVVARFPHSEERDNALVLDVSSQQWQSLTDPSTGQSVGIPFQLFGTGDQF